MKKIKSFLKINYLKVTGKSVYMIMGFAKQGGPDLITGLDIAMKLKPRD